MPISDRRTRVAFRVEDMPEEVIEALRNDTEHLLSSEKNAKRLRKSMAQFRTRSSISGRFVRRSWWRSLPIVRWFFVEEVVGGPSTETDRRPHRARS